MAKMRYLQDVLLLTVLVGFVMMSCSTPIANTIFFSIVSNSKDGENPKTSPELDNGLQLGLQGYCKGTACENYMDYARRLDKAKILRGGKMKRDSGFALLKREEKVNMSGSVGPQSYEPHQLVKRANRLPNLTKFEAKAVQTVSGSDLSFSSMRGLALYILSLLGVANSLALLGFGYFVATKWDDTLAFDEGANNQQQQRGPNGKPLTTSSGYIRGVYVAYLGGTAVYCLVYFILLWVFYKNPKGLLNQAKVGVSWGPGFYVAIYITIMAFIIGAWEALIYVSRAKKYGNGQGFDGERGGQQ